MRALFLVMTAVLLTGSCAAVPRPARTDVPWEQVRASIRPGKALIYVAVRPDKMPPSAARVARIFMAGELLDVLRPGSCAAYPVSPGDIELAVESGDLLVRQFSERPHVQLNPSEGDISFVEIGIGFWDGVDIKVDQAAEGQQLIKQIGTCKGQPTVIATPETAEAVIDAAVRAVEVNHLEYADPGVLRAACISSLPRGSPAQGDSGALPTAAKPALLAALRSVPVEDLQAATDACITGMLGSLHDSSKYLNRAEFQLLLPEAERAAALRAAVGLELRKVQAGAEIVEFLDGSRAAASGIRPGDVIIDIDGIETAAHSLAEIAGALRGPPESVAHLRVTRQGVAEPMNFEIPRTVIDPSLARGYLLESGIAYVSLRSLSRSIPNSLVGELKRLLRENGGPLSGIVVDLRRSAGGLLNASVAVVIPFLPPDCEVVTIKGRAAGRSETLRAEARKYFSQDQWADVEQLRQELKDVHLVVLVGATTAAGSEIVASALHHYRNATLVGQATFGKGTVENVFPLPHGSAVKVTTDRIYLADGSPLEPAGLNLDFAFEPPPPPGDGANVSQHSGDNAGGVPPDAWIARAVAILKGDLQ